MLCSVRRASLQTTRSGPVLATARRGYNTRAKKPDNAAALERLHATPDYALPPREEWQGIFAPTTLTKDRLFISNPATGKALAESFIPPRSSQFIPAAGIVDEKAQGKVVIEAFPGPGTLTRSLLKLPRSRLRKLIVLEDWEGYYDYLKPLEKIDDRLTVLNKSGFNWDTYTSLEERGLLEGVDKASWEGMHPNLHWIAHIPHTIPGEQLVNQLFRCMPEHSWLFKYGRVPMSMIMGDWLWQRVAATTKATTRCKLSIIANSTAICNPAVRAERLLPYDDHFFPTTNASRMQSGRTEWRRTGAPHVAINILPRADMLIQPNMLDKWDYVLRRLFVLKSTPLKRAINSLAPGAATLVKPITEAGVDVDTQIRHLELEDWAKIVQVFDDWPFAPEDLMIGEMNLDTRKR